MSMKTTIANNICAACGEKGEGLKSCTSCKEVKYCNAICQRTHWKHHKKECKQRAAELKLLHEEALFKEPPKEECPLCCIPFPGHNQTEYQMCCGVIICLGCKYRLVDRTAASISFEDFAGKCPYCREPVEKQLEAKVARVKKRMEMNDAYAFYTLGVVYALGNWGLPVDNIRAFELYTKAAELGCSSANFDIGRMYFEGRHVAKNEDKAMLHLEIAAMGGNVEARHMIGGLTLNKGNAEGDGEIIKRGLKHLAIAARAGDEKSLTPIRLGCPRYVTKDEYASILRAYQRSKDDMKSDERERAAKITQLSKSICRANDPVAMREMMRQMSRLAGTENLDDSAIDQCVRDFKSYITGGGFPQGLFDSDK